MIRTSSSGCGKKYESDVADEIAQNIEAMIGSTKDTAPVPTAKHPTNDTTTSKFATMNLQFGRNYDVNHKSVHIYALMRTSD